jgi:hypothetical protein
MKGWPAGATFDQTVTLDTVDERIEFSQSKGLMMHRHAN